jgi:protein-S-isoprenylcysteine O-methyltransferase Ste14
VTEAALHHALTWVELALAAITAVAVSVITAPYGRHTRPGFGPTIGARAGWILMESPAVILWLAIYLCGPHRFEPAPLALAALWQGHYLHRTFVFPFRASAGDKRMPLMIPLSGVTFNCLNAYVNARWVSAFGSYPAAWLVDARFLAGAAVFAAGLVINVTADNALLRLRRRGRGYQIPHGSLYEWVSCPNYLGEIIEWAGWALATRSLAGLAFAVYTVANLAPRAWTHHRWYRQRFADYPRRRRALVPFLF